MSCGAPPFGVPYTRGNGAPPRNLRRDNQRTNRSDAGRHRAAASSRPQGAFGGKGVLPGKAVSLQRIAYLVALVVALVVVPPASAAVAPQPPLDISKLDYAPLGHFKAPLHAARRTPATACQEAALPHRKGEIFNPSGKWNAFDNNVFEILCCPFRGARRHDDERPGRQQGRRDARPLRRPRAARATTARGSHGRRHLRQPPARVVALLRRDDEGDPQGLRRHGPHVHVRDPGSGPDGNTRGGRAINTAVVVPGADNPDETVIVGAHYDKTLDGPAAAWDSQEGHAEMIRMAKLMADYWKATGTRPSATVKFIPWDAEESGVFGSEDYVEEQRRPGRGVQGPRLLEHRPVRGRLSELPLRQPAATACGWASSSPTRARSPA